MRRLLVQTKWQEGHFMSDSLSGTLLKTHKQYFLQLF